MVIMPSNFKPSPGYENPRPGEALWPGFIKLVAEVCCAKAAAVARLDGAQIHLIHTSGMPSASWIFPNEIKAAEALENLETKGFMGESRTGWSAAATEILHFRGGTVAGALYLFAQIPNAFPLPLFSQFARHAEHLLASVGWGGIAGDAILPHALASEAAALKSSEPILQESLSLFRSVFENSLLPIFFWNTEDRLVDTNQAAVDLLGYTREDCQQGRVTWRSIVPSDCQTVVAGMHQKLTNGGAAATFEIEFLRSNDEGRILTQIVAAFLPGRKDMGVAFVLDMTPRRIAEREMQRAQEALRQRERSLRLAIQAGNLGTWDFNPTTKHLKWSRRCLEIFGIGPRHLATYAEFLATVCPADRCRVKHAFQRILDPQGVENRELEFRILRRCDHEQRWVMARAQAFFGEGSGKRSPCVIIGTLLDITERKGFEAELCRAKDVAEAASAAKDQFIAKLSHELRTPLTPVLMQIDLLLARCDLDASLRNDLRLMQRNVQLEARLIDDLLDVTRIAHGKLDLHLEEVNVHRLLEQAAEICLPQAQARNITACFRLEARECWIGGDPARLEQVFWNLLQNATKFTPPGGIIQIATFNPTPDRIVISIRDNGIGIESVMIQGLFDAFEQGGTGITRKYGGLGLGLAICKGVIELHGGSVRAVSEGPGRGATFTVELRTTNQPAVLPSSPHLTPETPSDAPSEDKDRPFHLLVVEDHPHTADVIARLLRRTGYAVALAHNIAEAETLASQQHFDMVVSDIGLPDGNGRDLMTCLKDRYGLKGIALSGFGTEEDIRASLAAGFVEHVVKPVEWKRLEEAVRRVLHAKS